MSLASIDRTSFLFGVIFSTLIFMVLTFFMRDTSSSQLVENRYISAQSSSESTLLTSKHSDDGQQDNTSKSWQEDDSQAIHNDPVGQERAIKNWQQVLRLTLSEHEALTLSELPVHTAAEAMSNDAELLTEVLTKVQLLQNSEQRTFLIRAINEATPEVRKQASTELLGSDRVLDRKTAVSLMMALENTADKVMLTQYLLQTENNDEVIEYALSHMSSDNDKDTVTRSLDELKNLAEFSNSAQIKGLAIQTIMKVQPNDDDVFEQVTGLVSSIDPAESYQGLNILHQQLNDYGKPLSEQQMQSTQEQLNFIANDANQPLENRIKALSTLKVLVER